MATGTQQIEKHYRFAEAAKIIGVSRQNIYKLLRGEEIVDFARPGKKGTKLIPESTLKRLLDKHRKIFR
jgi:hypothetical protein